MSRSGSRAVLGAVFGIASEALLAFFYLWEWLDAHHLAYTEDPNQNAHELPAFFWMVAVNLHNRVLGLHTSIVELRPASPTRRGKATPGAEATAETDVP